MVQYSEHFCLCIFFHSPAKLLRCFYTLQDNQFCTLTYIQVGFVLHVVVFNCHVLSFQENLRTGKYTHWESWHTSGVWQVLMTEAPQANLLRTSFMIFAPFLSLNSSWAMASSMLIPRICGRQQKEKKKAKCFCVVFVQAFKLGRKHPCSGSNHFCQVPHFVFAVLDLPPAVMDLLQKRQPKKTIQNGHLEDTAVQTLPTLTQFFSSYLI